MTRRRGRRARRLAPLNPQADGGADAAAPMESSKSVAKHLGAPSSSLCDGPYRWRTPAPRPPPTPALAVGRIAFALALPDSVKTAHTPKLRVHAAPATCTLSPHLSHLVEHSRRSRRSLRFSLPYSKLDPTRDTHKRESSTRRASVGLATLPTRPRGKGVSRKVRAGSWPARAGCPVRCAPKRRGQGSGFSA